MYIYICINILLLLVILYSQVLSGILVSGNRVILFGCFLAIFYVK